MKKKRLAILIAGILLLVLATPVYAITAPDDYNITQVNVYQSCFEANDQLYLITFYIDDAPPPDENANQAWLFRLLDETDAELGVVAPYATDYNDDGYNTGLISIYFTAAEVATLGMGWDLDYTIQMTGNPALDWGGDPPAIDFDAFTAWSTDPSEVTSRIRVVAAGFETDWTVDLIEYISGSNKLTTTYGEDYFTHVVERLRTLAPDLFSSTITSPEFEEREYTHTVSDDTEDKWGALGVDPGGLFDFTDLAALFGISRMWFTSLMYIAFALGLMGIMMWKIESGKLATFVFGTLMVVGSFLGFMPFVAGILCGLVGALALAYTFFWRGSV